MRRFRNDDTFFRLHFLVHRLEKSVECVCYRPLLIKVHNDLLLTSIQLSW